MGTINFGNEESSDSSEGRNLPIPPLGLSFQRRLEPPKLMKFHFKLSSDTIDFLININFCRFSGEQVNNYPGQQVSHTTNSEYKIITTG